MGTHDLLRSIVKRVWHMDTTAWGSFLLGNGSILRRAINLKEDLHEKLTKIPSELILPNLLWMNDCSTVSLQQAQHIRHLQVSGQA